MSSVVSSWYCAIRCSSAWCNSSKVTTASLKVICFYCIKRQIIRHSERAYLSICTPIGQNPPPALIITSSFFKMIFFASDPIMYFKSSILAMGKRQQSRAPSSLMDILQRSCLEYLNSFGSESLRSRSYDFWHVTLLNRVASRCRIYSFISVIMFSMLL